MQHWRRPGPTWKQRKLLWKKRWPRKRYIYIYIYIYIYMMLMNGKSVHFTSAVTPVKIAQHKYELGYWGCAVVHGKSMFFSCVACCSRQLVRRQRPSWQVPTRSWTA
jgi:hypothetical protein